MSGAEVSALVSTGPNSGLLEWAEFVDDSPSMAMMMGGGAAARPARDPVRQVDTDEHMVAARVKRDGEVKANAIFVADVDMISDFFFQERTFGNLDFAFDNVTFVLNAVDSLAGESDFIALRSRRPAHRSLTRVELEKSEFLTVSEDKRKEADAEAEEALEKAEERLSAGSRKSKKMNPWIRLPSVKCCNRHSRMNNRSFRWLRLKLSRRRTISFVRLKWKQTVKSHRLRRFIAYSPFGRHRFRTVSSGIVMLIIRVSSEKNNVVATRRR